MNFNKATQALLLSGSLELLGPLEDPDAFLLLGVIENMVPRVLTVVECCMTLLSVIFAS